MTALFTSLSDASPAEVDALRCPPATRRFFDAVRDHDRECPRSWLWLLLGTAEMEQDAVCDRFDEIEANLDRAHRNIVIAISLFSATIVLMITSIVVGLLQ